MTLTIWQVDSFADEVFEGNPAAVCILEEWLEDTQMLNIAMENNLSETAFVVHKNENQYGLKWYTPAAEVDLCGHATLAAAFVLFEEIGIDDSSIIFHTRSGELIVKKLSDGKLILDFPSDHAQYIDEDGLTDLYDIEVKEWYKGKDDIIAITHSKNDVASAIPNLIAMKNYDGARGFILTSPGDDYDFVSRCFYPRYGIDEDPVTGSAYTVMTPYWAHRLKKNRLVARQISHRGGDVECIYKGDRTSLIGTASLYMKGEIYF